MTLDELKDGFWEVAPKPILQPSATGWDSHSSMTPVVFRNSEMGVEADATYGMLYIGIGRYSSAWGVGYASSNDLFNWVRHKGNPVILQDESGSYELDAPCLMRDGEGYTLICEERQVHGSVSNSVRRFLGPRVKKLLRAARRAAGQERPTVVNHADGRYFVSFSAQDVFNWDLGAKKVVFDRGQEGAFDSRGVFSPQVYSFDGRYQLFYGGTDGKRACTGLATSDTNDGGWTRATAGPILAPGPAGSFDECNALIVSVLKLDDCYCAFYEGEDESRRYGIGMAWSHDLVNWVKWDKNPVVSPGGHRYCEHMVCGPRVFRGGDDLFLFFNAHDKEMRGACGLAVYRRKG